MTWVLAAGCAAAPDGPKPSTTAAAPVGPQRVDPVNIERVRGALPAGYEVAAIAGPATPLAFWGLRPGWTAEPPRCGSLADALPDAPVTRGWSGSGEGGIVFAVVTGGGAPVDLDPSLTAECGQWTVSSGQTSASVGLVDAPTIDGAATVGMATETLTVVEGGTETRSHADTFTAYLGEYVAVVTVVTDPGSPHPAIGPQFAAGLLVKTVSALRG